jgi:hypothetical protein
VLDEHAVFEDADLRPAVLGTDDHLAVDRLTTREELRLGDDRSPTTGIPSVATALLLRLEARGTLDRLGLGDVLDDALAGLARFVTLLTRLALLDIVGTTATAAATAAGRLLRLPLGDAVEHALAARTGRERKDLGSVEVQLRRYLRDEDLGQQPQRHSREGLGRLGLVLGRLSSGLFRRGFGRGSVDGRSVDGRSVDGRSVDRSSVSGRSLSGTSLSGRSRSLSGRSCLGGSLRRRCVLSRSVLSRSIRSRSILSRRGLRRSPLRR